METGNEAQGCAGTMEWRLGMRLMGVQVLWHGDWE